MLKAALLAATTIASTGERSPTPSDLSAPLSQATKVPIAISILTSTSVSPASLVFLGGRLVQTNLKAEHKYRHANALMGNPSAYRECGTAQRSMGRHIADLHPAKRLSVFYSKMLEGPALEVVHVRSRYSAHARNRSRIQRHKEVRPVR